MSYRNFVLVTLHKANKQGVLSDNQQRIWDGILLLTQEYFHDLRFSTNYTEEDTFNIINLLLQPDKKVDILYILMPSQYFELYNDIPYLRCTYDISKGIPNNTTDLFGEIPLHTDKTLIYFLENMGDSILNQIYDKIGEIIFLLIYDILSSMYRFGCTIYDCDLVNIVGSLDSFKQKAINVYNDESCGKLLNQSLRTHEPKNIIKWIRKYLPHNFLTNMNICNKNIVKLQSPPNGRLTLLFCQDCVSSNRLYNRYNDILEHLEKWCVTHNTSIQINCVWITDKNRQKFTSTFGKLLYGNKSSDIIGNWYPMILYEPDIINQPDTIHIYNGNFTENKVVFYPTRPDLSGSLIGDYIKIWLTEIFHNCNKRKPHTTSDKISEKINNTLYCDLVINVGCPTIELSGTRSLLIEGGEPIIIINDGTPVINIRGGTPNLIIKKGNPIIKLQGGNPNITYI